MEDIVLEGRRNVETSRIMRMITNSEDAHFNKQEEMQDMVCESIDDAQSNRQGSSSQQGEVENVEMEKTKPTGRDPGDGEVLI